MTFLETFCKKLEPSIENRSITKSILYGVIIYMLSYKIYNLNCDNNNYTKIFMMEGIKYIINLSNFLIITLRLDEYRFYYKSKFSSNINNISKGDILHTMFTNDITTIITITILNYLNI